MRSICASMLAVPLTIVTFAAHAGPLAGHRFLITSVRTGDTEIFEVDPDSGDARNVTRSPDCEERYPCWSPDGKQIAFTSNRDGTYNLYVCNIDGSGIRQLTNEKAPSVAYMPSWVGDRIVFGLHCDKPEMASVLPDGTDLKLLGSGHDPCFSPDGTKIAYTGEVTGGVSVFVMNADGNDKHRIVKDANPWGAIFPDWSPDGKQIVYSFKAGEALELFIVDADGKGEPRQLTRLGKICTPAAWSPDGKWISFRYTDEAYWRNQQRTEKVYAEKPGDKRPVWVIRPDGSDAHVVEPLRYQCAMDGSRAAWKPNISAAALLTQSAYATAPRASGTQASAAARRLAEYRAELSAFRKEFGGQRELPAVDFFLFGMGPRPKLLYKSGALIDATTGKVLHQWSIQSEIIVPPDYAVYIATKEGQSICLVEDEQAVWIEENGQRQQVPKTQKRVRLPGFDGRRYSRVLRVLHQELLVNVIDGRPVPNYFVYGKPWYRDGAMMAMCLKATGNLDLIKDWVLNLSEAYDRNNAGEAEADNLGQALYLISLFADRNHPLVPKILKEFPRFEVRTPNGKYIKGRSDFAEHPAYQTKWAKYGLSALKLDDPYVVPRIEDSYAALFWWGYKDAYVPGKDANDRSAYPYLGWACDHFHGARKSPISNRDYPLTWEQRASQAKYDGMRIVSPQYTQQRLAAPHTWHAAEIFLYLLDRRPQTQPSVRERP